MNITRQRILFVVIALGMSLSSSAVADDRTADEILEAYKAVKNPVYDKEKKDDKEFMDKYWEDNRAANHNRAVLTGELFRAAPDHERLVRLMPSRWSILQGDSEYAKAIAEEMAQILADSPDSELAIEVHYSNTTNLVSENTRGEEKNYEAALEAIESFISKYPNERRCSRMLQNLARSHEFGSDEQIALYNRIIKDYPDNSKYLKGKIKQASSIGKPFTLKFQDAITGTQINMEELKGQVVVIDFWATWCGPCVAEIPHMKELYAKYHDDGVQFIGISLDNAEYKGGLEALLKYAIKNEVPWPQYYQGNGWTSDFSMAWGINSIPALFVIDKNGNLNSVQARGRLEELIPELLAE